jgi:hypothetical protein
MGLKDGRGPVKSTNNTSTVNLPAHSTTHINNLTNTATTTSYYNSVTLDFGGEIGAEGTREISKMISNELKKQELLINNTNIMTNFRPKI